MTQEYNQIAFGTIGSELASCTINNFGDECAVNACTVESRFVNVLFDMLQSIFNSSVNNALKHDEGFDAQAQCDAPVNTECFGASVDNSFNT